MLIIRKAIQDLLPKERYCFIKGSSIEERLIKLKIEN